MQPNDSCRLSAVNLYSFVKFPFTENAELDLNLLYEVFYEQVVLSDDLVDLEIQAVARILNKIENKQSAEYQLWENIINTGKKSRRVGNGFTALADMFAALNITFGSVTSRIVFSEVMNIKLRAELDATVDLAILRGTFKGYDSEIEYTKTKDGILGNNEFYRHIYTVYPQEVRRMIKYGRRNVSWSTLAPTGTISLMTQTSSGIEPVFSPYYIRRMKVGTSEEATYIDVDGQMFKEFVVVHPKLMEYAKIVHHTDLSIEHDESYWKEIYQQSPYYNSCSADIYWKDRLKIQQIAQRKTTHSISSTLNLPSSITEEEVSKIFMTSYDLGLKGVTIYRDGSRGGILVNSKKDSSPFTTHKAPKRPKVLDADIYTLTNAGTKFLVAVGMLDNKPYEVFVKEIDKEDIITVKKGTITKVSKGHYQLNSSGYYCENIHENNNMEKKATALYVSMLLRHGADLKFIIKTAKKVDDNIASFTSAMCRVLSKYIEKEIVSGEVCPECGGKIIHEAGCVKCVNCSYSKCLFIYKKR